MHDWMGVVDRTIAHEHAAVQGCQSMSHGAACFVHIRLEAPAFATFVFHKLQSSPTSVLPNSDFINLRLHPPLSSSTSVFINLCPHQALTSPTSVFTNFNSLLNPRMLSDTMDTVNHSFFLDAIPDETAQGLVNGCQDYSESHDMTSTDLPDTDTGSSKAIAKSRQTPDRPQERNTPPQSMLIFVLGEHSFSDSRELGVLNEHPEALKTITSNQCLSTSAFLNPAMLAVMAELRQSMMVQVAVRLTAVTLRLVAEVLPNQYPLPQYEGPGEDEQQKLSETVRHELEQALPYYQWQGPRNYYGRVQYLMALLEEAIRVLAVPMESLTAALKADEAATRASQRLAQSILDLGLSPTDVYGVWAADILLSMRASRKGRQPPRCLTPDSSKVKESGVKLANSPDFESEDELPSPSEFVRRKLDIKASQTLLRVQVGIPKAAKDDVIKSGSAGKLS